MKIDPVPAPAIHFDHGQVLWLGQQPIEVRHTPGHTPGHVVFYAAESGVVFCGDLIFYHGVGRTDLPGGDWRSLLHSIREKLFPLGDAVEFHPGHGPAGILGDERRANPFVGTEARRGRFL